MSWVPIVIGGWLVLSLIAALVIGMSIRRADRRGAGEAGAARGGVARPRSAATAAEVPDPRRPHPADGTRSNRRPVGRDRLPTSDRQPAAPTADSR